jgi:lysozyme family protein
MTTSDIILGLLRREGGYRNVSGDPETNWGITKRTYESFLGRKVTSAEMRSMTPEQAGRVYWKLFITNYGFDRIAYEPLQVLLVDYHVNSGIDDVARAVQTVLGLTVDGIYGPKTRQAVERCADPHLLYLEVWKHRSRKLVDEALDDPSVQTFLSAHPESDLAELRGWNNRILQLLV